MQGRNLLGIFSVLSVLIGSGLLYLITKRYCSDKKKSIGRPLAIGKRTNERLIISLPLRSSDIRPTWQPVMAAWARHGATPNYKAVSVNLPMTANWTFVQSIAVLIPLDTASSCWFLFQFHLLCHMDLHGYVLWRKTAIQHCQSSSGDSRSVRAPVAFDNYQASFWNSFLSYKVPTAAITDPTGDPIKKRLKNDQFRHQLKQLCQKTTITASWDK